MHIWLIDDDKKTIQVVQRILALWGHKVRTFATRQDSIIALETDELPDGLVTDFNLGPTTTCEAIIAMARDKKIGLLVVISGDPHNENNLPDGVHFFVKPINFYRLKTLLTSPTPST